MSILFANNAVATLASGISGSDTAVSLSSGKGALFPSPSGGDYFLLTLTQAGAETSWEIVKVTSRSGDLLTVVRAQEGTAAAAWSAGSKAEIRITAEGMSNKQDALVSGTNIKTVNGNTLLGSGDLTVGGSSTLTIDNKTGAYTVISGDNGKIINCTSGTFTVSLTAAATLGAGFNCWIVNSGSGLITVDPSGSELLDGAVNSLALRSGMGAQIICEGTGFLFGAGRMTRGYSENFTSPGKRGIASGSDSFALGYSSGSGNASASGANALAIYGSASSIASSAIGANSGGNHATAVTGSGAMALGGSYASGTDSFAAAIANNTSSYGATGANSVAIGQRAQVIGANALAAGKLAQAIGAGSIALGGSFANWGTLASGGGSVAIGDGALAQYIGKVAITNVAVAAQGDSQTGMMVLTRSTSDATPTVVTSNNGAASTSNQVILPNDSAYHFRIQVVGMQQAAGGSNAAGYTFTGVIRRGANAAATSLLASSKSVDYESDTSWDCAISADTTNGGLAVTVTGAAATNIRWVATCWTSEVTYA